MMPGQILLFSRIVHMEILYSYVLTYDVNQASSWLPPLSLSIAEIGTRTRPCEPGCGPT
jgi:hypothetical protein